ncbi:hypothetical protein KC348_g5113 [Hortaea werneckii]|nr:hypothetical protein KC348_g5113 [Hortaea werneckii]
MAAIPVPSSRALAQHLPSVRRAAALVPAASRCHIAATVRPQWGRQAVSVPADRRTFSTTPTRPFKTDDVLQRTNTEFSPFSVEGKTAIVTGAGSGINYVFAKQLLERNCNVLLADLALRPDHPSRISQTPQCPARTRAKRRSRRRAKKTKRSPSIRPSLLSLRPTRGEETRKRERRRRGRRNWIVSSSIAHDWSSPS